MGPRATGRTTLTLHSHGQSLYGLAFNPDGRLLAMGSPDGTIALHVLPLDDFLEVARSRVTRALTDDVDISGSDAAPDPSACP